MRILLPFFALMLMAFNVTASARTGMITADAGVGDVNCDGQVNITDVTTLIDYILTRDSSLLNLTNADTDKNEVITIADVTTLIDYILDGTWPWDVPYEPQTETFTVNGVTFTMVAVEGGTFTMGATAEQLDDAYNDEMPAHEVTLTGYAIGQTEVTQALWQAVMGNNPSSYTDDLQCPVDKVSWDDCQVFISRLNQLTGRNFRLPTEAEWEFAARGGNWSQGFKYAGSNTPEDVAWYRDISLSMRKIYNGPYPVATKDPNELGLYDMSGNVSEWCSDWYDTYSSDAQTNPLGPSTGVYRVTRGGNRNYASWDVRVSSRDHTLSISQYSNQGLRLAMDADDDSVFRLSETALVLNLGDSTTVNVMNGHGDYSVQGCTGHVTVGMNGNELTLTATSVGSATVQITDNVTGSIAVLAVVVTLNEEMVETFTVDGVTFTMVTVEGGTFTMGATAEQLDEAESSEMPAHEVRLSSYAIGQTEVTQALWKAVMRKNPSAVKANEAPVENVTWENCQEFITKLNQLTGRNFRLPSEAEWEYAARGGIWSQGYKYAGSNAVGMVALFNNANGTYYVAKFTPNELGLYDMSGNVDEWCQDYFDMTYYSESPAINPTGPVVGTDRVYRGGSCHRASQYCRVSSRCGDMPTSASSDRGLRLAL